MDLLKTPSVQSLMDSDLESVESFPYLDIEELDEVEYALPASEAPTLAEVLSAEDEGPEDRKPQPQKTGEPTSCSALQADFLQAVSQQLLQAEERSSAGAATTLSAGKDGKITVGTAHGHILSFQDQTLRWVCDSNTDRGAVSCLAYNSDTTRLLAGYARNLICQYESIRGVVLRRVTLGCDIWGTLRVTWAGTSGLALDTGGSVWLMKFSRPLGVRSARTSCLFSGARGEVVAMSARDARILAMATLSRVIIVAGGRATGVRLGGPPDTLPVIEWCESDERVLVCARARILQWLSVTITGASIALRPLQRVELAASPLWVGWLGGTLAILDVDENLRLWGDDYDKPLDLSYVEPVYASAFFKGLWTDGRVSRAMGAAGAHALGGVCAGGGGGGAGGGALTLLGRRGVLRVRPRDTLARARALLAAGRHTQALRLLCSSKGPDAKSLATQFVNHLADRPHILSDKAVADQAVKLCVKYNLGEELWCSLWEACSGERAFVEAVGDAAVRGELAPLPPSPDSTQALIEQLASHSPSLVERVLASLPLTSLDPHRASLYTRSRGLWRGVGAVAAALGGPSNALRELIPYVDTRCGGTRGEAGCACAGGALLLAAADALAGRGAGGRALPDARQHAARHDALLTLLHDEAGGDGKSPLRVLVEHDASATMRLLEQSARHPPFAGPLGKQNRLRVARALVDAAPHLSEPADLVEIVEFISGQLVSGSLPADRELVSSVQRLAACCPPDCARAAAAWRKLLTHVHTRSTREQLDSARSLAADRPRVLWRIEALLDHHESAITQFLTIADPSTTDVDEFLDYLNNRVDVDKSSIEPHLPALVTLRPAAMAAIMAEHYPESMSAVLSAARGGAALAVGDQLLAAGRLAGDAAAEYFRQLCEHRPDEVDEFLVRNPGVVRPEEALSAVRAAGLRAAEPRCLEAAGELDRALDAMLRLGAEASQRGDKEAEGAWVERACRTLSRACAGVPRESAGRMWARLLRHATSAPPALLLDAAAYLPLTDLIDATCSSPGVALALLRCAALRRAMWAAAARGAGREAHVRQARAVRAAGGGVAVRGACVACGTALHTRPVVRTGHCGRAVHADCPPEGTCGACGRRLPPDVYPLPPARAPAHTAPAPAPDPHDLELRVAAPPRPDLEGIV